MNAKEAAAHLIAQMTRLIDGKVPRLLEKHISFDGRRTLTIAGRSIKLAIPLFKGTWSAAPGASYEPGDVVQWNGGVYHCNTDTTKRPDSHFGTGQAGDWTLMIKPGRDGKDYRPPAA